MTSEPTTEKRTQMLLDAQIAIETATGLHVPMAVIYEWPWLAVEALAAYGRS